MWWLMPPSFAYHIFWPGSTSFWFWRIRQDWALPCIWWHYLELFRYIWCSIWHLTCIPPSGYRVGDWSQEIYVKPTRWDFWSSWLYSSCWENIMDMPMSIPEPCCSIFMWSTLWWNCWSGMQSGSCWRRSDAADLIYGILFLWGTAVRLSPLLTAFMPTLSGVTGSAEFWMTIRNPVTPIKGSRYWDLRMNWKRFWRTTGWMKLLLRWRSGNTINWSGS